MSHVHNNAPGWEAWGGKVSDLDTLNPLPLPLPLPTPAVVENVPEPEDALVKLTEAFVAAGYSEQQAAAMARDTINHRPEIQKELDADAKQLSVEELEAPTAADYQAAVVDHPLDGKPMDPDVVQTGFNPGGSTGLDQ